MVSRPFVAAALAGWAVGDPVAGAAIGVVLESFQLTVLPVGAARYPEGGPAAVAGGAVYAASDLTASTMLLSVLLVLVLEWIGGQSVQLLRRINVRLVTVDFRPMISAKALENRHLAAIGLDFTRGILLVAFGSILIAGVTRLVAPYWGIGQTIPRILLMAMTVALFTSAMRMVGLRAWFAVAGAIGAVAILAARA
jgi:hypothetical protein